MVDITKTIYNLENDVDKIDACKKLILKRNDISDLLAISKMMKEDSIRHDSWTERENSQHMQELDFWNNQLEEINIAIDNNCSDKDIQKMVEEAVEEIERYGKE